MRSCVCVCVFNRKIRNAMWLDNLWKNNWKMCIQIQINLSWLYHPQMTFVLTSSDKEWNIFLDIRHQLTLEIPICWRSPSLWSIEMSVCCTSTSLIPILLSWDLKNKSKLLLSWDLKNKSKLHLCDGPSSPFLSESSCIPLLFIIPLAIGFQDMFLSLVDWLVGVPWLSLSVSPKNYCITLSNSTALKTKMGLVLLLFWINCLFFFFSFFSTASFKGAKNCLIF